MKPHEHVILEIARERERQVDVERWTPEHDDGHVDGSLGLAAAVYAAPVALRASQPVPCGCREAICHHWMGRVPGWGSAWPWDTPPKHRDRRSDLVRAAALIVAEIERLDRAAAKRVT